MKRAAAIFLAAMLIVTGVGTVPVSRAKTESITVTPYAGQWKYYGQTKKFIQDEHYSLSEDAEELQNWYLDIESEEVGQQNFVLRETTTAVSGQSVSLVKDAPTFEVRAYTTPVEVEPEEDILNIEYVEENGRSYTLHAPSGYQISDGTTREEDTEAEGLLGVVWDEEMEIQNLIDGSNEITYYLRSHQDNATRNAIDQTPKTTTIMMDTKAPVITELSGDESSTDITAEGSITADEAGTFYYMVVPAYFEYDTVTDAGKAKLKTEIKQHVQSSYGIVGYGKVDGEKATSLHINGLAAETEYKIYAYMVDKAGNESEVAISGEFKTDKMSLSGNVEISGTPEVDSTLTATPQLDSIDPGALTYQWYRVKVAEDAAELDEIYDNTGGADEDDIEASDDDDDDDDDDEDDEDDEDEDDEDDDDGLVTLSRIKTLADDDDDDITTIDDADPIEGATSETYKVTKSDIGYRLIAKVTAENYSGYVAGSTSTFVPKLMPTFSLPVIASAVYSPVRKLSSIKLPQRWSWVDSSIVPVYGNSGYRAKYVPADSAVYKTVIVRVKVPVTKKALKKSMVSVAKKRAYTGKSIKNNFTVKDQKVKLRSGKDFDVSYKNNKKIGKATITFTGTGNYKGKVRATYKIQKKSVKGVTCRFKKIKRYTGKKRTAGLVLKNGSVKMKKNRDYTVVYKKNVEIGKASIVIRGKGNYKGKRTLHFTIVPRKPAIRKVVRKKGGFQLTLSSQKESKGYYVQVSSVRSFKKSKTQSYVTAGNRFGLRSLEKRSTWYVRVRSYTVKKGKTYNSAYSKVKKVKVK
ncbi:MAG: hypothetical protein J1F22_05245 [Lachnospiraceae bacterium]|nr:hypothetical protein [Lachnospiraceae bacterium]